MKTLLLICLIFSMIIYLIRIIIWTRTSIIWMIKPEAAIIQKIKELNQTKITYIIGGIEHLIIFGSLLASTLIIF
jgi:hypothetical protein